MTLFLGGGGDIEDSVRIDKEFFNYIDEKSKILYIATACDFTTYENCFKWFYSLVTKYVSLSEENIIMLSDEEKIPELSEFKAIYIGGGNTYKLLNYICKTGLKDKIVEFLDKGGLIFGGSAGAIIFGTTIETVAEERENYPDNLSISYVKKYAIRCHYQKEEDNLYQNLSKSLKQNILAIPEDGGIIIDKDDIKKIIGDVILFSANQKQILRLNNAEI